MTNGWKGDSWQRALTPPPILKVWIFTHCIQYSHRLNRHVIQLHRHVIILIRIWTWNWSCIMSCLLVSCDWKAYAFTCVISCRLGCTKCNCVCRVVFRWILFVLQNVIVFVMPCRVQMGYVHFRKQKKKKKSMLCCFCVVQCLDGRAQARKKIPWCQAIISPLSHLPKSPN